MYGWDLFRNNHVHVSKGIIPHQWSFQVTFSISENKYPPQCSWLYRKVIFRFSPPAPAHRTSSSSKLLQGPFGWGLNTQPVDWPCGADSPTAAVLSLFCDHFCPRGYWLQCLAIWDTGETISFFLSSMVPASVRGTVWCLHSLNHYIKRTLFYHQDQHSNRLL